MVYHAKTSSDFVGLRTSFGGRKQVVYDADNGRRVVLEICDSSIPDAEIDAALKEGIVTSNVLRGVIAALHSRNIQIDFAI